MSKSGRIDTHQHIVPPPYAQWIAKKGYQHGIPVPKWTKEGAIAIMDNFNIDAGIVSVARPGVHLGDGSDARDTARMVNEFSAEVVKDRPDRFGFFASVPLPDIEGAIDEAVYALDVLGADGLILLGNAHGLYLGDPSLDPLMEELNNRSAVVFLHPTALPGPIVPELPAFITDFPIDTTRAVVNLVRHHIPRRYPNVKFILAHAGGAVPYLAHRLSQLTMPPTGYEKIDPDAYLGYLKGFYYDTALSASPSSFPSLLQVADPTRIFYGSDWPWVPVEATDYFTRQLDESTFLDEDQKRAINRENAEAVFPRFA